MSKAGEFWDRAKESRKKDLAVILSGSLAATGAVVALEGQDTIDKGQESRTALESKAGPGISLEQQQIAATSEILRGQSDKRSGFLLTALGSGLLGGAALSRKKSPLEHSEPDGDSEKAKQR